MYNDHTCIHTSIKEYLYPATYSIEKLFDYYCHKYVISITILRSSMHILLLKVATRIEHIAKQISELF